VNQVEGFAVVLQVAVDAILPIRILHLYAEVVAMLVGQILGNFLVAIQALERGSASAENMTGTALRCSSERRVCFG
jgi:hypothetical protein